MDYEIPFQTVLPEKGKKSPGVSVKTCAILVVSIGDSNATVV